MMSSTENPFAFKPDEDLTTEPVSGNVNLAAFVSPGGLRSFSQVVLIIFCLISLVSIGSAFLQIGLLTEARSPVGLDFQQRVQANDARVILVGMVQLLALIVAGFASLKLLHRLRSNVDHLGAGGLKSTPGWSIGWFFVPFAHLYKPLEATRQTYQASASPQTWQSVDAPGLFKTWWFFWIVSSIVGQISTQYAKIFGGDVESLIIATWIAIAHSVLMLIACICYLGVLNEVTDRQLDTYAKLAQSDNSTPF